MKPGLKRHQAPEIHMYQTHLHIKNLSHKADPTRVKQHCSKCQFVFRLLLQTSWTLWCLAQPCQRSLYFISLPRFFYGFSILPRKLKGSLPKLKFQNFLSTFYSLTYHWPRKDWQSTLPKELSFLIIKWFILSKQLFQMKLSMIDTFANGIWYP